MPDMLTETEQFLGYMHFIMKDVRAIRRDIQRNQIDIDQYDWIQNSTQLKLAHKSTRTPIICTYVLATYPTTSTAVSLQVGSRTIPLNPTAGYFNAQLAMQIEYEDDIILNIAPAGAAYLEIMGYSDKRRIDETNNV